MPLHSATALLSLFSSFRLDTLTDIAERGLGVELWEIFSAPMQSEIAALKEENAKHEQIFIIKGFLSFQNNHHQTNSYSSVFIISYFCKKNQGEALYIIKPQENTRWRVIIKRE